MQRLQKFLSGAALCIMIGNPASSQTLTQLDVDLIGQLANTLCIELEQSGGTGFASISAKAEADIRALLRILGGGSADIDFDALVSRYDNVPRSELMELLNSGQSCRLKVFGDYRDLVVDVRANTRPQEGGLTWNFPHMIKDGIALGAISASNNGSGVNVYFRLRNATTVALNLKLSRMSYVDIDGNVCQKGSLSTGASGIGFRSSDSPTTIPPGDTIQFSADNIRCDRGGFGEFGDVLVTVTDFSSGGVEKQYTYELSGVGMAK